MLRLHVQRPLTNLWLDRDLEAEVVDCAWALSGPGSATIAVEPELLDAKASDGRPLFEKWGTLVYVEDESVILWGGIVTDVGYAGSKAAVVISGFTAYPTGIPYLGETVGIGLDPLDLVRTIWSHVQAQPGGNLGVVVDATKSTAKIGTPPETVTFTRADGTVASFESGDGEYRLVWWETPDCGNEITQLCQQTPFDYVEEHAWTGPDRMAVSHNVRLGYPRLGRRREDLAFVQGVNLAPVVEPEDAGDRFANEGIGIGKGQGRDMVMSRVPMLDGRLRRPTVFTDKLVSTKTRMTALVREEVVARQTGLSIPEVTVLDHPNAPLGSWTVGDDVLIQAVLPWVGNVAIWHRIVGWSLQPKARTAKLFLRRTDSFIYRKA